MKINLAAKCHYIEWQKQVFFLCLIILLYQVFCPAVLCSEFGNDTYLKIILSEQKNLEPWLQSIKLKLQKQTEFNAVIDLLENELKEQERVHSFFWVSKNGEIVDLVVVAKSDKAKSAVHDLIKNMKTVQKTSNVNVLKKRFRVFINFKKVEGKIEIENRLELYLLNARIGDTGPFIEPTN